MKTTKFNIGIALSRNYDKISLEMLDEPIEHSNEEELIKKIREKFKLLRIEVEQEFGNEKPQTNPEAPQKEQKLASKEQKEYLKSFGFNGDMEGLTMKEASTLITEFKNKAPDY